MVNETNDSDQPTSGDKVLHLLALILGAIILAMLFLAMKRFLKYGPDGLQKRNADASTTTGSPTNLTIQNSSSLAPQKSLPKLMVQKSFQDSQKQKMHHGLVASLATSATSATPHLFSAHSFTSFKLVSIIGLLKYVGGGGSNVNANGGSNTTVCSTNAQHNQQQQQQQQQPVGGSVNGFAPSHIQQSPLTQWLSPSSIHFLHLQTPGLNGHANNNSYNYNSEVQGQGQTPKTLITWQPMSQDTTVTNDNIFNNNKNEISNNINDSEQLLQHHLDRIPLCLPKKLQVTEKDGSYIALDNNSLQLMRRLEKMGHCTEVEVEIVPLSKVPPNIVKEIFRIHGHRLPEKQRQLADSNQQTNNGNCHQNQLSINNSNNNYQNNQNHLVVKSSANDCETCLRKMAISEVEPIIIDLSESTNSSSSAPSKPVRIEQGSICETRSGPNSSPCFTSTTITTTASVAATIGTMIGTFVPFNTYLSDQQLKATRMTNTMVVMAPCLRQPITTSTPSSSSSSSLSSMDHHSHSQQPQHGQKMAKINRHHNDNNNQFIKCHKNSNHRHPHHHHSCNRYCGHPQTSEGPAWFKRQPTDVATDTPVKCICVHHQSDHGHHHRHGCHHIGHHHHQHHHHHHEHEMNNCYNNNCTTEDLPESLTNCSIMIEDEDDDDNTTSDVDDEEAEDEDNQNMDDNDCQDNDDEDDDDDEDNDEDDDEDDDDEEEEEEEVEKNSDKRRLSKLEQQKQVHEQQQRQINELFACNVCGRLFKTARSMAKHQVFKRHFGCSICDTVFPTLPSLELHKQTLDHWSDDEEEDDEEEEEDDEDDDPDEDEVEDSRAFNGMVESLEMVEFFDHSGNNCEEKSRLPKSSPLFNEHRCSKSGGKSLESTVVAGLKHCSISLFGYPQPQHRQEEKTNAKFRLQDSSIVGLFSKPTSWIGNNQTNAKSINNGPKVIAGSNRPTISNSSIESNKSKEPIFTTSLSNKLMASVFNFSSASNGFNGRCHTSDSGHSSSSSSDFVFNIEELQGWNF